MSNYLTTLGILFLGFLPLFPARPDAAGPAPQAGASNVPVTTVVTVLGPNFTPPPALSRDDFVVHTGNRREDIVAWDAAQGEKSLLELAIVIDELSNIGNQLDDIRKFIQAQPKGTSIGLFYASNGITQAVAPFRAAPH